MEKRHPCAGSAVTAVLLALFLLVFTLITVYLFWTKAWWFPESVTAVGREIDAQFMRTLWITGLVFVASQLALAWLLVRFRDRGGRATYSHGNNTMEVVWTLATAVLFIGLGIYAQSTWAKIHLTPASDPLRIEVTGQQFAWNFRYAGPDGQFGRTDPKLINDAAGNPIGLDPDDPAGADDLVLPIAAVPVDRDVEFLLRSKDVIHSLFVRELRIKQDAVPGLVVPLRFRAERTGSFEAVCTELCGMQHHRMRTVVQVLPAGEYENWLREQREF